MHKVLLTTPRFYAFEAMIREHLAEHGCEVLEHQAHDMQMEEETLPVTLAAERANAPFNRCWRPPYSHTVHTQRPSTPLSSSPQRL